MKKPGILSEGKDRFKEITVLNCCGVFFICYCSDPQNSDNSQILNLYFPPNEDIVWDVITPRGLERMETELGKLLKWVSANK